MSKKLVSAAMIALLTSLPAFSAEDQNSNALVAELVLAQGKYDITGPGLSYNLNSDYASRFKFSYLRRLNEKLVLFGTFSTYEITVLNSADGSSRKNKMGGYEAGARYYITPRWSATLSLENRKEIFFEQVGGVLNGIVDWTPRFSAGAYFKAFEKDQLTIVPSAKLSYVLGSGDKKSGLGYQLNSNFNYFFPIARASFGVGYESRTQKYKEIELTESGLQFSLGAGYSF